MNIVTVRENGDHAQVTFHGTMLEASLLLTAIEQGENHADQDLVKAFELLRAEMRSNGIEPANWQDARKFLRQHWKQN